ncbi:MAG: asparagine synthase (glutamine-hydrolyzing) [Thermoanaerobaculia bacterium]
MCGINGIYAYDPDAPPVDRDELMATRECMLSRGPDGAGSWMSADGRIALAHRRLSIIDLSPAGSQPMQSQARVIVFNGEIYNFRELRARLEQRGRTFVSHSDTEVLLQLYDEMGEAMLRELRGMFAIALWDAPRRRLFLARDPYGIKPLYLADDGRTVRIASQVKALIAGGRIDRRFEPAAAAGFFLRGTVPEPFTMYRAIRALPAGSFCYVDERGAGAPVRFFSIAATFREALGSSRGIRDRDRSEIVREALLDSVRHHLVADVPVGAFLSAGIDSTAIVGLAREAGATDLKTMTLRFAEYRGRDNDEAPLAALVARHYGVSHEIRELTLGRFRAELPRIFAAMDQPSVDGLNSYFVSQAAASLGLKVALSGAGGDELFGGYTSFRDIPRWMPFTRVLSRVPGLAESFYRLNSVLAKRSRHISPKMGEILRHGASWAGAYLVKRGRFLAAELPDLLGADLAADGLERLQLIRLLEDAISPDPGSPFARVATLEAAFYLRNQLLRDMDWASMAHSLEVRVPLVDAFLLQRIAPALVARDERGKQILASAPRPALPAAVRQRRKTGFTLPIGEWLRQEGVVSEPGKRGWARKVYEVAFSGANGYW